MEIKCLKSNIRNRYVPKLLLTMRLTIVILIASMLQVSAASYGQKKVTFVKNKTTLWSLFAAIKAQTGYKVLWSDEVIKTGEPIDVNFKNATIDEVMSKVLAGKPVTYVVVDETIVIRRAEPSFRREVTNSNTTIDVRGRVLDENGGPLVGAIVKIKGTKTTVVTDSNGEFSLTKVGPTAVLLISFIGYQTREIPADESSNSIRLALTNDNLKEVEVFSTGYQNIPKERATGSFTQIDNKTFDRAVTPDVLSRLKGVTNGVLFQNNQPIVRGKSTIFSTTAPLIVVDNFPFEGDLNTLNPNDIENVTVLKDAAAASIWGARAGNGVIVITTKKGRLNQTPSIDFNVNLTIGGKPDLYHRPQLSSSDFIDLEKFLFDNGAYNGTIANKYGVISPVVALLNKVKLDPSFEAEATRQIDILRTKDIRDQQTKYFYRKSTRQQYYVNINGGGPKQSYYFSGGFDKNLPNDITKSDSRITLKANNTYSLLNDRLSVSTDLTFSKTKNEMLTNGYKPFLPYEQVADENGNPLTTLRNGGLREQYTDSAGKGDLLDWKYRPLEELRRGYSNYKTNLTDYRLNLGLDYKIFPELIMTLNYQYYKANREDQKMDDEDSFYTRDMINKYSQINTVTRAVSRPIPKGDIYTPTNSSSQFNYGRIQLNYNALIKDKHQISALAGTEIRDESSFRIETKLYGYNPETATSIPVDLINQYRNYFSSGQGAIQGPSSPFGAIDRYISIFGNASYSYDAKYILSGSYRKDESNLFGVKANQKGVPLWSTGIAWSIDKEGFFKIDWLHSLQLKATYGYNGNVNKTVSAYLTASPASSVLNVYKNPFYQIINPPNDDLKWERVKNINLGLYFSTKQSRISGSLEYYVKNGLDLIASSPIAPQTGTNTFIGNTADVKTKGIDVQINSHNLTGLIKWSTVAIFNYAKDKVTEYKVAPGSNVDLVMGTFGISPVVGYPINSVFAFKWAGLDGRGNPIGYLNGTMSSDYSKIINSTDRNELIFFGSRIPTVFGAVRNTFSYKMVDLSFNVSYKFGYYFFSPSLNYNALFSNSYQQPGYDLRWKDVGDEFVTTVPKILYPDGQSGTFYNYSSIQVERGNHIRLNDIRLDFNLTKSSFKRMPFSNLNIYCYATNLGILWKANNKGLDPDDFSNYYPEPKTISLGFKTSF